MGTFNPNPSQLPRPKPPLRPLVYAVASVRHLRENTSKSFVGCGNNKYGEGERERVREKGTKTGHILSASWPLTSASKDATPPPPSNLPLNHFNFKQIDITLPSQAFLQGKHSNPTPFPTRPPLLLSYPLGRNWKYFALGHSLPPSRLVSVFVRTSGNSITINVDGNDESNAKLG